MKQEQSEKKQKRKANVYSAKEKTQAVLALWSGRRSMSDLMKAMDVPWGLVSTWEKRALSGMLHALDPKRKLTEEGPLQLPVRLEKLIGQVMKPEVPENAN